MRIRKDAFPIQSKSQHNCGPLHAQDAAKLKKHDAQIFARWWILTIAPCVRMPSVVSVFHEVRVLMFVPVCYPSVYLCRGHLRVNHHTACAFNTPISSKHLEISNSFHDLGVCSMLDLAKLHWDPSPPLEEEEEATRSC
jgi:hypothetical protein